MSEEIEFAGNVSSEDGERYTITVPDEHKNWPTYKTVAREVERLTSKARHIKLMAPGNFSTHQRILTEAEGLKLDYAVHYCQFYHKTEAFEVISIYWDQCGLVSATCVNRGEFSD